MEILPKLRADLVAHEQIDSDNNKVVVIQDPLSEKYFRLTDHEYQFLKKLDGTRSIEDAVESFRVSGRHYLIDDAKMLVSKAAQLGLVLGTQFSTAKFQNHLRDSAKKAKSAQRLSQLYFLYIPLVNPDRFLEKTLFLFRWIANRWLAGLLLALLPGALYFIITGLPEMQREYSFFFNLENLLYLWITILITKLIHEFSHAYVAKSFGLRVPQMGVAFLIFFPCLFCNTTDAWQLADRRQRIAISAAGILAEAVVAILSTYLWHFSRPGMINSLAFYLMAVSFISTILFNGNPLMKFDGYFILIDYIGKPNLQAKSSGYLRYLFLNRVLGNDTVPNTASSPNESVLFAVYGVSFFLYRIFLYTGIVSGVYYRFDKSLGITLALIAFGLFIIKPIVKGSKSLWTQRKSIKPQLRGSLIFVLILGVITLALFVPFTRKSVYPCKVESTQIQKIAIPLHAAVSKVNITKWAPVTQGDVLFELDPKRLRLELARQEIKLNVAQKELELFMLDSKQMGKAQSKITEIHKIEYEIKKIAEDLRVASEGVTAPFDAAVTTLDHRLAPGFEPGEGVVIGELQSTRHIVVQALIPEDDRDKVWVGQDAQLWFPIDGGLVLKCKINSINPYDERDLKNSPFSSRLGGELATEPRGDSRQDAPIVAQYQCSIYLEGSSAIPPLGMTGDFIVSAPPRSLFERLVHRLGRTFARETLM
jgi:putative peptide zinc metalloprotease protein